MRAFDWRALLDKQRIHYIERGANVKRGEINIQCPFCGSADPSQHLGLNLTTGWYSCWRQRQGHSGKSPLRLLMRLLRIDYKAARELAGFGEEYVDPEGFDALAARIMGRTGAIEVTPEVLRVLKLDPSFLPIEDRPLTRRWHDYLYNRYFEDVEWLCRRYALHADRRGARIILPYTADDRLVTWTGRAIGPARIRYLDLPRDDAIIPAKETLYLFDHASEGGDVLCVVEGPIDALKIDAYGHGFGMHAVALSTNSISKEQLYMLEELAPKFREVLVVMDNKTDFGLVDSMRMKQELATIRSVSIAQTPFDRSDPGELTPGRGVAMGTTGGRPDMGSLTRFFNAKFHGCMIVGVTRDPHRERTITVYALHDEPGMVGMYDGIDRWATSASSLFGSFGQTVREALTDIDAGKVFEIEYGQTMQREGDAPGVHPTPVRTDQRISRPRRMANVVLPKVSKERRRAAL